ncbi:MAG: DDE-type integrase/transposase/recombinase, partial [Chloroflexi bacterium]|nr:DDE-type integrase/transposase/recombinase [Chloroflexota bacterium]
MSTAHRAHRRSGGRAEPRPQRPHPVPSAPDVLIFMGHHGTQPDHPHIIGAPKELLVDNARALVTDANAEHFRWNPQFLELCGHYRVQPRACRPYRAQTKGKIERPFFYLEEQFL